MRIWMYLSLVLSLVLAGVLLEKAPAQIPTLTQPTNVSVNIPSEGFDGLTTPYRALYIGAKGTGNKLSGFVNCDSYAKDRSTTADVQLVPILNNTTIYICGYIITGESTVASDVNIRYSTNANCTTGAVDISPPITLGTSTSGGMVGGVVVAVGGNWSGMKSISASNVCVHRSAVQTSEIQIWYTQF